MTMDHWRRRPSTTAGFAILIADARVLANEVNVLVTNWPKRESASSGASTDGDQ
jgi:hypothetical protein